MIHIPTCMQDKNRTRLIHGGGMRRQPALQLSPAWRMWPQDQMPIKQAKSQQLMKILQIDLKMFGKSKGKKHLRVWKLLIIIIMYFTYVTFSARWAVTSHNCSCSLHSALCPYFHHLPPPTLITHESVPHSRMYSNGQEFR